MKKSCKKYTIIAYASLGDDQDKHVFPHLNKREVVGIMKTVMDNFDSQHIDIFDEDCWEEAKE
jgi:hypothetical protein